MDTAVVADNPYYTEVAHTVAVDTVAGIVAVDIVAGIVAVVHIVMAVDRVPFGAVAGIVLVADRVRFADSRLP